MNYVKIKLKIFVGTINNILPRMEVSDKLMTKDKVLKDIKEQFNHYNQRDGLSLTIDSNWKAIDTISGLENHFDEANDKTKEIKAEFLKEGFNSVRFLYKKVV